jgi:ankyrin repeat protein
VASSSLRQIARTNAARLNRRDDGLDFSSYRAVFDFLIAADRRRIFKALELGFDVNLPDKWGFLVLHRACVCHLPDVVAALIDQGSSLEAEATARWRPLHMAAISNASGCPTLLVRAGALVDISDASGNTPLHLAADIRSVSMVRELLELGFDPAALNAKQQTPGDVARVSEYIWYEDQVAELTGLLS